MAHCVYGLVGPLPPSTIGVKYIIVAIDYLTKWVEARSVKDLGARTVARFVQEQIIHRHGCPQFLLTDNATNFTGRVLPRLNYLIESEEYSLPLITLNLMEQWKESMQL